MPLFLQRHVLGKNARILNKSIALQVFAWKANSLKKQPFFEIKRDRLLNSFLVRILLLLGLSDFQTLLPTASFDSEKDTIFDTDDNTGGITSALVFKSANQTLKDASERPIPQMLFGELWYQTELCIFFADTNLGKSILAVQIADSISSGKPIPGFKLEASAQPVVYCDFELSDKQFELRYSEKFTNHYRFSDNLLRAYINPDMDLPKGVTFEIALAQSLEAMLKQTGAKVLIIDNITYLRTETEKAKDALPLMKELKALKAKYDLSILCLAHTPKRNLAMPLTKK